MEKRKKTHYAIAKGRKPGIYKTWFGNEGAEIQIKGIQGARYKGFYSLKDAQEWFNQFIGDNGNNTTDKPESMPKSRPVTHDKKNEFTIFTDGGCSRNPGPGGYGVVLIQNNKRKELSGGFRLTTNNRMEMMACIVGLQALERKSSVTIYSDSKYVVDSIMLGWAKKWRANNWMRNKNDSAVNPDLWKELLDLLEKHDVLFKWVKGHAGNEENERCDQLAVKSAAQHELPADEVYENKNDL